MDGMKGINEGYSGFMTKLRICIGLIATALIVGELPAHAGTTFRTAKVCAQTESGMKIINVKFTWTYPGTVGGSGTTDKTGCFTAGFLPVGEVSFSTERTFDVTFNLDTPVRKYRYEAQKVQVLQAGSVSIHYPDPIVAFKIDAEAEDPSGHSVLSTFKLYGLKSGDTEACRGQAIRGVQYLLTNLSEGVYLHDPDIVDSLGEEYEHVDLDPTLPWTQGIVNKPRESVGPASFYLSRFNFSFIFVNGASLTSCNVVPQITATAVSGTQKLTTSVTILSEGKTILKFSEYLQGFIGLPKTLKAKSGKITLITTLHDNQNQPISGTPVKISEPKSSNPNIGKKVGSCKPVLTATTNAQGKATFTLCPTKHTTVTVKAPPLGIVSQSITVTK